MEDAVSKLYAKLLAAQQSFYFHERRSGDLNPGFYLLIGVSYFINPNANISELSTDIIGFKSGFLETTMNVTFETFIVRPAC